MSKKSKDTVTSFGRICQITVQGRQIDIEVAPGVVVSTDIMKDVRFNEKKAKTVKKARKQFYAAVQDCSATKESDTSTDNTPEKAKSEFTDAKVDLSTLTVAQLREIAEEKGIALPNRIKKADLIEMIGK